MAKRTRVARTAPIRPGTRPASVRGAAAPRLDDLMRRTATAPLAASPTADESAALPIGKTAFTSAEAPPTTSAAAYSRSTPGRVKVKANSLLAARAETEYVYVGRDLRKIAIVMASLFGILIALWILLVVLRLSGLY